MHRASVRAIKHRKNYLQQQSFRQNYRYLRIYHSYIKKSNKTLAALNCFSSKINLRSRSFVKDACIFTGRSRAVTSIRINRMQVRPLMEAGALKGLKKLY